MLLQYIERETYVYTYGQHAALRRQRLGPLQEDLGARASAVVGTEIMKVSVRIGARRSSSPSIVPTAHIVHKHVRLRPDWRKTKVVLVTVVS